MGIAERQAKERKRRIDMILDAATQVIMDNGIERATMDEIASVAELGKATIYNYFASKQLLLLGLDLRGIKKGEEGFRRAYEEGQNGLDRALKIGHFYFDHAMESPVYFQAKVQLGSMDVNAFTPLSDDPMVNEYMQAVQRIHRILADAIADGIHDGTIRSNIHPEKMSLLLWCQSNGVIDLIQNRGELVLAIQGITVEQIRDGFFRAMECQLAATGLNQPDGQAKISNDQS